MEVILYRCMYVHACRYMHGRVHVCMCVKLFLKELAEKVS